MTTPADTSPAAGEIMAWRWTISFAADKVGGYKGATERKKAMQKLATDYPTGVFRYRFPLKEGGVSEWHYYEFFPSHGFGEGEVEFLCGAQLDASRAETDAANARAEALEAKLAKAVKAQRRADGELSMLEGACAGILADAEELERWWPKSKRGSNAKRVFESIMSRRDAIVACARDARAILTEIEGTSL